MGPSSESYVRKNALILSGGGARGAYEVGVLWYIFDEFARARGGVPSIQVLSGTSVGALNACYLASHLSDPMLGMRHLVDLWSELEAPRVLGFGPKQLLRLPKMLFGGAEGTGFFDARPLSHLVENEVSWRAVSHALEGGRLDALSVSTTEVSTGRTVVFIQTAPDLEVPRNPPPRTLFRSDRKGPLHALASGAIPIIFPPIRIDGTLYLDGGLRQNTPVAPALRLGATHVLAIGGSRDVRGVVAEEGPSAPQRAPGAAFLLGKILNAFLLDHFDADIELLARLNNVIADGTRAFGESFTEKLSVAAAMRGAPAYRYVKCLTIRPSEDIGRLASEYVQKGAFKGDSRLGSHFFSLLDFGISTEADLASYLLFDGGFARRLIEMGRSDAHARRSELSDFFGEEVAIGRQG